MRIETLIVIDNKGRRITKDQAGHYYIDNLLVREREVVIGYNVFDDDEKKQVHKTVRIGAHRDDLQN